MAEEKKINTVLIVDDSSINIDILTAILNVNYTVKSASDGEEALEILRVEPYPDLILLDVMMPGMNGYEVCAKLKQNSNTSQINTWSR